MLTALKQKNKYPETVFLGTLTLFCFALSLFRCMYAGTYGYIFLNWNLFLAFIPWALTTYAVVNPTIHQSKLRVSALVVSWLLFFPNAPYILTDLFHLRGTSSMPMWFDLVLILSFAWTGLLFGLLSLWDLEKIVGAQIKPVYIAIGSSVLLFISSFGVYIGRFLRFNSWDVLREPYSLIHDVSERVIHPFDHPRTWGVTIFMGLFLNMVYWSLRLIRKENKLTYA
ncbi:MAG TPA: DUF1361 domain-containing protein [Flavobacteriales bacterium]|nr:DUF1361 domain-containing protein [Flavobacteriales bacterium]